MDDIKVKPLNTFQVYPSTTLLDTTHAGNTALAKRLTGFHRYVIVSVPSTRTCGNAPPRILTVTLV